MDAAAVKHNAFAHQRRHRASPCPLITQAWGFAGQLPDGGRSVPLCPEAGGKMKDIQQIIREVGTALEGLSESERLAAAQRIFGVEPSSGL